MIKKLKFKFILVSLLSVLFVLLAALSTINTYNYLALENEGQQSLDFILEKEFFDDDSFGPTPNNDNNRPKEDFMFNRFDIRAKNFFLVSYDSNNEVEKTSFRHIFYINSQDGINLANDALKNSSSSGKVDYFRYKKITKEDGRTLVAFIDLKEDLFAFKSFLISSIIVVLISYVLMGGLIIFASQIIFKTSEKSYQKQKSFITNASHELKTPLTIISTDVEIMEMDYGKSEWSSSIKDQVARLTSMTNQLVTLSKLEEDFTSFPMERFNLSSLFNEAIESFLPSYKKNELILDYDIEDEVYFYGNHYLIDELINIFLENALKYSKTKGEVNVSLRKNKNNKIDLIFINDIDDNLELDLNQLFERFYRSPSTSKKEGSGIGLSIAKEIIQFHKGKIKTSINNRKIKFIISF